jgi:16S rRNA (cytosine967-C5)-methyltransferase
VDAARDRVFEAVASQVQRFPDLALDALDDRGLGGLDAAFAHALYDQVIRRWLTLEHACGRVLTRPWDTAPPAVRAALLVGAAQVMFMSRVPSHAAVHGAVGWARARAGVRSSSAVNAVLRRIAELCETATREEAAEWADDADAIPHHEGGVVRFESRWLPEDPLHRLAVATSHPRSLLQRWTRAMPMREVRRIALHGLARPPVILNTTHASGELPSFLTPHNAPGHHVHTGTREELVGLLDARRDLWVQDPASSLAVESISDLSPALVIDACAGLGSKTRQLEATFPGSEIVATDIDLPRRRTLESVFASSERVTVIPYERLLEWAGRADLALLDVPCSNTAVLARRVEARYRHDRARSESLTRLQRQLIADAIPLLRDPAAGPRHILYSTCSLDPAENEEQPRWASRWHRFDVERERRRSPEGGPGRPPESYSDGSYAALLS